MADIVSFLWL